MRTPPGAMARAADDAVPDTSVLDEPQQGFLGVVPLLVGSAVGLAGGATFVSANAGMLPGPWSTAALVAGGLALAVALWATFGRRHQPLTQTPRRGALTVYLASVAGMLALIALGTRLLPDADVERLRPPLIALAVGLHFLPFAWAFPAVGRLFATLGMLVAGLGVAGLVVGLGGATLAGPAAAVLAGLTMLVVIARHNATR